MVKESYGQKIVNYWSGIILCVFASAFGLALEIYAGILLPLLDGKMFYGIAGESIFAVMVISGFFNAFVGFCAMAQMKYPEKGRS